MIGRVTIGVKLPKQKYGRSLTSYIIMWHQHIFFDKPYVCLCADGEVKEALVC